MFRVTRPRKLLYLFCCMYFCTNVRINFCSTDNMPENIALAASHIPYMNLMPVYGKWDHSASFGPTSCFCVVCEA